MPPYARISCSPVAISTCQKRVGWLTASLSLSVIRLQKGENKRKQSREEEAVSEVTPNVNLPQSDTADSGLTFRFEGHRFANLQGSYRMKKVQLSHNFVELILQPFHSRFLCPINPPC